MKKLPVILCMSLLAPLLWSGTIVTAPSPGKYEKTAVKELLEFLPRLTGEKWQAVNEKAFKGKGKNIIFLGNTAFARKKGLKQESFAKEFWRIKTFKEGLVITGGKPIGTLYGAYDFLKKCGVRFVAMDETCVPRLLNFKLPQLDIARKPSFAGRLTYDAYPHLFSSVYETGFDWIFKYYNPHRLRTGTNGTQHPRYPAAYMGDFWRRTVGNVCHTYVYYVNPRKYMKDHPEYYSMDKKGKRFFGQLCLSNKKVWDVVLENLRTYIRRDRKQMMYGLGEFKRKIEEHPVVYCIGQMDGSDELCFCPECTKIRKEDNDSGLQLRFINYVAREIRKEFPDVIISTMAYVSTDVVPKITKPEKNVYFQYDDLYISSDPYRPLTHAVNKAQLKKFEDWLKFTPNICMSDFGNIGGKSYFYPPRQEVTADAVISDLRYLHKKGVRYFFEEYEKDSTIPQPFFDLHCYLKAELLMDVNADAEKIIADFIRCYYGPKAAPVMAEYFKILREGVKIHPTPQRTMLVNPWSFCTPEFFSKAYRMLTKAHKLAGPKTRFGRRIREEMIPLLWEILVFRKTNMRELTRHKITVDQLKKECYSYTVEYISKYGGKNVPKLLSAMKKKFDMLFVELDYTDVFPHYSPNDVKVFGYPHAREKGRGVISAIVNDPDTPVGKALRCTGVATTEHGRKAKSASVWATFFALHDGKVPRGTIGLRVKKIPRDEKYHWYKVPQILDCAQGDICFWSLYGYLEFNMSTLWRYADGRKDMNRYEIWFSAKFTGPAYVKGSKQANAIWVDRIIAIWENAAKAKPAVPRVKK